MDTLNIKALTDNLGVEITNLDPNIPLNQEEVDSLQAVIKTHHLVLLKSDHFVEPENHIDLTRKLGTPWSYGYVNGQYESYPEIFKVTNQDGDGFTNVGQVWHSDGSIYNKAMHLSLFTIKEIPDDGASTYFTSLSDALKRLSTEQLELLQSLEADYGKRYKPHPVIWRHPLTNQEVLHISEGIKSRFKRIHTGEYLTDAENEEVHKRLNDLLWEQGTYYEHQWKRGDLLIADNYALAHNAKPTLSNTLRVLHRTATKGIDRRK